MVLFVICVFPNISGVCVGLLLDRIVTNLGISMTIVGGAVLGDAESILVAWIEASRSMEARVATMVSNVFCFRYVVSPWAAAAPSVNNHTARPTAPHPHDARLPTAIEGGLQQL